MSIKSLFFVLALIGFFVTITGCIQPVENNGKIKVVATIYPLYEFSKRIGGDKVDVSILVPAGAEPHDWEPGPKDIIKIESAKIFVYNGAGFERWVGGTLKGIESKNLIIVDSSSGIMLLDNGSDPHMWLDPISAEHQVDLIKDALIRSDPQNSEYYNTNADSLKKELILLDVEIRSELGTSKKKVFITSHAAFGYFSKRYGLTQVSVAGLSPDVEPSPAKIAEIIEIAKKNDIKYIFFETLVNPRMSEVIANEAGARTLVLNPIEGLSRADMDSGKTYFTVMRENLKNLKIALGD
jgi:zinc transport system substrate-binding protein